MTESFYRIGCYSNNFRVKLTGDFKGKDVIQIICYLGSISSNNSWWTTRIEKEDEFVPCSQCKNDNCTKDAFSPLPPNQSEYLPKATCGNKLNQIVNI